MENQQVDVDALIAAVLSDEGENDADFKTYVANIGPCMADKPGADDCPRLTNVLFAAVHRHDEKTLQAVLADSRVRAIPKAVKDLGDYSGYVYANNRK